MTWQLRWSRPAINALQELPWPQAARIDAAIQRLAASGEGEIFHLAGDDAVTARLRVGLYVVRFTADPGEQVIWIWYVYRWIR